VLVTSVVGAVRSLGRQGWAPIFVAAVLVRVAFLASPLIPGEYVVAPYHVEVEAVARSLVVGGGYANPYLIPTGPTAHPLPVQTALQALVYLLFGVTAAAGFARSLLGIVAQAASFAALPWLAERVGLGRRAGFLGGMAAAVIPWNGIGDALGWWWNESDAGLALAVLLAAFVRRWAAATPPSTASSLALGGFAGFAFHLAPALLPVVGACAGFEWWWVGRHGSWRPVAAIAAGALLACTPWTARNYAALGDVLFIRSNFGLELRLGNRDGAQADLWSTPAGGRLHPGNNEAEARRVREFGEAAYMRACRDETLTWIASHPGAFARLTAARAWHVWFGPPARPAEALPVTALTLLAAVGLARARRRLSPPQLAALVIPLATFPLVSYLLGYVPRYTLALQGLLLMLAGGAFGIRVPNSPRR
jgi:hypothetical protein